MVKYDRDRNISIPYGLGNAPAATLGLVSGRYDLVLFNNATKKAYVFTGLTDVGTELYYDLNNFDPGDIPCGEYGYALVFNILTGVEYTLKNSLLDTELTYNGTVYRLADLMPELGLLKYLGDTEENTQYRDTEKEFYYRKK